MKRPLRVLACLILLIVSPYAALKALEVVDYLVGFALPERTWSGGKGLLFDPGTEDSYVMRDYTCTDRINSLGFRDREFGLRKASAIRILALGDSTTYGWGVNLEDTWCKRLEENLRKQGLDVEVLNLGKPAAGPYEYARIAEAAVPALRPDYVLVGFFGAEDLAQLGDALSFDMDNFVRDSFPNILYLTIRYRNRGAQGGAVKRTADDIRKWYAQTAQQLHDGMSAEQRSRFDAIDQEARQAFLDGKLNPWMIDQATNSPQTFLDSAEYERLHAQIRKAARQLARIRRVAARYGAKEIVASVPEGFTVNKEAYDNVQRIGFQLVPSMLQDDVPDRAIAEACKRAGVETFHSVTDAMRRHIDEKGLYFEFDRHMTAAGNALYADLITPFIAADLKGSGRPLDSSSASPN